MVAVRDLSFSIEPGQILALLGPNGADVDRRLDLL
jgi:ABC-type multidrug transport system ATPase subunit